LGQLFVQLRLLLGRLVLLFGLLLLPLFVFLFLRKFVGVVIGVGVGGKWRRMCARLDRPTSSTYVIAAR
jgi:hypothetical protein